METVCISSGQGSHKERPLFRYPGTSGTCFRDIPKVPWFGPWISRKILLTNLLRISRRSFLTMKYLVFLSSLILSGSVLADEPSVAYECKDSLRTFISDADPKDRIDLCPKNNGFKIDAVSFGANNHMCWLHGSAKETDGVFNINDTDCLLSFKIYKNTLEANFKGECNHVCGAREWFKSGNYTQKKLITKFCHGQSYAPVFPIVRRYASSDMMRCA